MAGFLAGAALFILINVAASLIRVARGPARADRMMGAQLIGTGGVAMLVLLAFAEGNEAVLDVALILALLAAFAAVGFVKSLSSQGAGDPETER